MMPYEEMANQWIHVRHEEAGAYASMEAGIKRHWVLHGKQWSGHIHLINGLYDANKAGNPVIAIASTIHTQKWD
jgi:pyruvate dehydrogenase (quinone)